MKERNIYQKINLLTPSFRPLLTAESPGKNYFKPSQSLENIFNEHILHLLTWVSWCPPHWSRGFVADPRPIPKVTAVNKVYRRNQGFIWHCLDADPILHHFSTIKN
jgi:hypothetical protein